MTLAQIIIWNIDPETGQMSPGWQGPVKLPEGFGADQTDVLCLLQKSEPHQRVDAWTGISERLQASHREDCGV